MKRAPFTYRLGRMARLLACAALLCAAHAPAAAAVRTLDDPTLAARVNGDAIHAFTFKAMLHASQDQKPRPAPAAVLDDLIADRLMASWARSRFTTNELHPAARVGFARETAIDDKLVGLIRSMYTRELEAAVRALPGANLDSLVVETGRPDPETLDRLFGKPGRMQLEYKLDAQQEAHAAKVTLLRYKLGGQAGTLTVLDVLKRQNVQGRIEFINRNVDFMQQQARALLGGLFVQDWATRHVGAKPLADLRRALADQEDVHAAHELYGLSTHSHAESRVQADFARQVTQAEVNAYYEAHKEQFRRVERVKARHIRVADEAMAERVVAEARAGKDFAQLARRLSIAPTARSGGDLGWVHQTANPDWLASLALLQPQGQVSSPFRAAVDGDREATWEVLLVEQRVEGYHPPESETVRYLARRAIAHEKARREFDTVRTQALRKAAVDVNRRLVDERPRRLPAARSAS